jgi:hypothetical protein
MCRVVCDARYYVFVLGVPLKCYVLIVCNKFLSVCSLCSTVVFARDAHPPEKGMDGAAAAANIRISRVCRLFCMLLAATVPRNRHCSSHDTAALRATVGRAVRRAAKLRAPQAARRTATPPHARARVCPCAEQPPALKGWRSAK